MLRVAIVEDEADHAKRLMKYLESYAAQAGLEAHAEWFPDALSFLEKYRGGYEAVFLDIAMPHMDGMECARRLRELDENVALLFVTSMAHYAIRGYEVNAMDFLVKPVEYDEFAMKMERLCRYLQRRQPTGVAVKQKDRVRVLNVQDIVYIEIYNHELVYHTRTEALTTYGKLSTLEEDGRFSSFIRCSQSYLVNCAWVTAVGQEALTVVTGAEIPIARRKRKECMEKIAVVLGRNGW